MHGWSEQGEQFLNLPKLKETQCVDSKHNWARKFNANWKNEKPHENHQSKIEIKFGGGGINKAQPIATDVMLYKMLQIHAKPAVLRFHEQHSSKVWIWTITTITLCHAYSITC